MRRRLTHNGHNVRTRIRCVYTINMLIRTTSCVHAALIVVHNTLMMHATSHRQTLTRKTMIEMQLIFAHTVDTHTWLHVVHVYDDEVSTCLLYNDTHAKQPQHNGQHVHSIYTAIYIRYMPGNANNVPSP